MGRTVRELLGALDSRELSEWMAFDLVDPIGGRRGDIQAAVVASTLANVWRGKETNAFEIGDFIPDFGVQLDEKPQQVDMAGLLGMFGPLMAAGLATEAGLSEGGEAAPQGDDPDAHD